MKITWDSTTVENLRYLDKIEVWIFWEIHIISRKIPLNDFIYSNEISRKHICSHHWILLYFRLLKQQFLIELQHRSSYSARWWTNTSTMFFVLIWLVINITKTKAVLRLNCVGFSNTNELNTIEWMRSLSIHC